MPGISSAVAVDLLGAPRGGNDVGAGFGQAAREPRPMPEVPPVTTTTLPVRSSGR